MISITILAKNSEETIKKTLESVKDFPEVIVFDTGSTDGTKKLCLEFSNVKIQEIPFQGFGKTHNESLSYTSYDWVLSLDSDEVLTPELSSEIRALSLNENAVYALRRENFFLGKPVHCCSGWHPDWVVRLFNKKKTRFTEALVHEKVKTDGLKIKKLAHPLLHTPYRSIEDMLSKMQSYSSLFAKMHPEKRISFSAVFLHTAAAFMKSFFLKKGILGGKRGFILSLYIAHSTWYKYLKLYERSKGF